MKEINNSPVIKLKAAVKEFNFSKLTAGQDNKLANSGETMFLDFHRMNFTINEKGIDRNFISAFKEGARHRKSELSNIYDIYNDKSKRGIREIDTDNGKAFIKDFTDFIDSVFEDHVSDKSDELWKSYCENPEIADHQKTDSYRKEFEEFYNAGRKCAYLLPTERDENKDYRSFSKEVFKKIFSYAGAEVLSDSILEELVTNCNQAGYDAALPGDVQLALGYSFIVQSPKKVISINCANPNNVRIRSNMKLPIFPVNNQGMHGHKICDLSNSLEFTLESQNGEGFLTYANGKMSIEIPEELKNYKDNGKSLFFIIKEYFETLCTKLGFKFERGIRIEHDFGIKLDGTISTEGSDANKEFINLLSKNLRGVLSERDPDIEEEIISSVVEHKVDTVMGLFGDYGQLKNSKENRELLINEVADNLGISKEEPTLRSLPSLISGSVSHSQVQDVADIFTKLILAGKREIYEEREAGNTIVAIRQKINEAIVEQGKEATSEQQDIKEHKWADRVREQELSMKSHGR